jgi:RimJ/RimL family protein N-acetyltransferase
MLILNFDPTPTQCQEIANACVGTPEKSSFLNAHQPYPVPTAQMLASAIGSSGLSLSAVAYLEPEGTPIGYIFAGSFFPPHSAQSPHIGFGLNKDVVGHGYAVQMLFIFFKEFMSRKLGNRLYGHCYAENLAACKTMERAGMIGQKIGVKHYSQGYEVMEYVINL